MVGFSGILDTGWVEDLQMMRDKLTDEKKLLVDLKANYFRWSKMLVVNLMVILFHLKLDRFFCIEVKN